MSARESRYARAAREVSEEWIRAGRWHTPPDDTSGVDEIAFWDEVERRANALQESFAETLHPRDRTGRWMRKLGISRVAVLERPNAPVAPSRPEEFNVMRVRHTPDIEALGSLDEANAYLHDMGLNGRLGEPPPLHGAEAEPQLTVDGFFTVDVGDEPVPTDRHLEFAKDCLQALHETMSDFPKTSDMMGGLRSVEVLPEFNEVGLQPSTVATLREVNNDGATGAATVFPVTDAGGVGSRIFVVNQPSGWGTAYSPSQHGVVCRASFDAYGRMLHETGHVVDNAYGITDASFPGQEPPFYRWTQAAHITWGDVEIVSKYATSSPGEAWAEIFATIRRPGSMDELRSRNAMVWGKLMEFKRLANEEGLPL